MNSPLQSIEVVRTRVRSYRNHRLILHLQQWTFCHQVEMNKKTGCFWYSSRQHRNRFCHDRNDLLILLDSSHAKKWEFQDHLPVWAGLSWTCLGTNLHCRIHLVRYHKDMRSYGLHARTNMQTYDHWYNENLDSCSYLQTSSQTPLKCLWIGSQIIIEKVYLSIVCIACRNHSCTILLRV